MNVVIGPTYIFNEEERANPPLGNGNAAWFIATYDVGVGADGIVWVKRKLAELASVRGTDASKTTRCGGAFVLDGAAFVCELDAGHEGLHGSATRAATEET